MTALISKNELRFSGFEAIEYWLINGLLLYCRPLYLLILKYGPTRFYFSILNSTAHILKLPFLFHNPQIKYDFASGVYI